MFNYYPEGTKTKGSNYLCRKKLAQDSLQWVGTQHRQKLTLSTIKRKKERTRARCM